MPLTPPRADASRPAADAGPRAVPTLAEASPTWELELLVSGAVIFGLFQLPPVLDGAFAQFAPHATDDARLGIFLVYWYAKATVSTLIAAFVIHLVLRAYWVGLVGLNSVFPGGVRWHELPYGPIMVDVWREDMPPIPRVIERVDNVSSVIFAFAFLVAMLFLLSVAVGGVLATVAWGLSALLFGGGHFGTIFRVGGVLLAMPSIALWIADRGFGRRADPAGPTARTVRRLVRASSRVQMVRLYAPIMFTLTTNVRKALIYPLLVVTVVGTLTYTTSEFLARVGVLTASGEDYFTDESHVHAVESRHYESQWSSSDALAGPSPSVQADVIRDPYVRLFVPYLPGRHNAAVAARCPGLAPLQPRGVQLNRHVHRADTDSAAARALACLSAVHQLTVNGVPRPDVAFYFSTHPRTGVRGTVAYIPAATLPRGANVLTVMQPPRAATSARRAEADVIHFWL